MSSINQESNSVKLEDAKKEKMPEDRFQLLKQGAEAKIYTCTYLGKPTIVKERFQKHYRHPDLDSSITNDRIKNEARSIVRCKVVGVKTPCLYLVDMERRRLYMEYFVQSMTVKDYLINIVKVNEDSKKVDIKDLIKKLTYMIGFVLRKLHDFNIIHGDLTTSNMLLVPKSVKSHETVIDNFNWLDSNALDIALIDFGLSYVDSSTEAKGVDLYVLERALISTHNDFPELFDQIMQGYTSKNKSAVAETLSKFEEVRARGRKRTMVG